jgi:glycosyltransferase 2 family protein
VVPPPPEPAWRRQLLRGLALVLALAALGTAALVIYAGGLSALLTTLRALPPAWLLLALAAIALEWLSDAARFGVMAPLLGIRPAPRFWLGLALANMCATYAANAGTPVTAFLLCRRGVGTGKAFAFALVQQTLFVPACLAPACLLTLLQPQLVPGGAFRATLWLAAGVALLVILVLVALAAWPQPSLRVATFVTRGRARRSLEEFVAGVSQVLRGSPARLGASVLCSMINQAAVAGASVALLHGLGARGHEARAWGFSYLFAAVSQSAPTPGGAGVSEVGGAWLFHGLLPVPAVALHLLIWRFLAIQLPVLAGGLWTAAELRKPT